MVVQGRRFAVFPIVGHLELRLGGFEAGRESRLDPGSAVAVDRVLGGCLIGLLGHCAELLRRGGNVTRRDRREHLANVRLDLRLRGPVAVPIPQVLTVTFLGAGRVGHS